MWAPDLAMLSHGTCSHGDGKVIAEQVFASWRWIEIFLGFLHYGVCVRPHEALLSVEFDGTSFVGCSPCGEGKFPDLTRKVCDGNVEFQSLIA
jgi:hypothetical protein